MIIGLTISALGALMILFTWISYRRAATSLCLVREADLVSYYLDMAIRLLPVPFWSGLIGLVLLIVGIIIILINLPWSF